jgi:DNA-binding transcriptional LysR family regulator
MNITLRQLRAFAAVADTGAFARAAERLHVSPSGLSMLVRELEHQLGLSVFFRSTRLVRLTEAGAEFLPLARKALDDLEAAVAASRSLAQVQRGRVSVAASVVAAATLLPWALRGFAQRYPGIQCVVKDGFEEAIRDQVLRGEVDLGVGTLLEDDVGLQEVMLFQDHLVAVIPDGHPLLERGVVGWKELARHPLVALSSQSPSRQLADQAFAAAGVSVTPAYEASFSSTIISMVAAGLGVAALPVNVRQVSRRVQVHTRLLVRPTVQRTLGVFSRSDAALSPAAAAFRDHLQAFVKAGRGVAAEALAR